MCDKIAEDTKILAVMSYADWGGSCKALDPKVKAVQAANHLAGNIVKAVEPLVAHYPSVHPLDVDTMSTFFIARATDDGLFMEVAAVDVETGEIRSSEIVMRWMEAYSGVGEWVLDPYHGGHMRLTPLEYQRLVKRLATHYDVRFVHDVRTAHFFGLRRPDPH